MQYANTVDPDPNLKKKSDPDVKKNCIRNRPRQTAHIQIRLSRLKRLTLSSYQSYSLQIYPMPGPQDDNLFFIRNQCKLDNVYFKCLLTLTVVPKATKSLNWSPQPIRHGT